MPKSAHKSVLHCSTMLAELAYYEANFKTYRSKKNEVLRYAVTTATTPAVELDSCGIRIVILKGKHDKDINIASVEKFMLGHFCVWEKLQQRYF